MRVEPVVLQDDCRGLLRDIRAANPHRHADVRFPQRRRVVHAITKHGDDVAPGLKRRHESQLVLRRDAAERSHVQQPPPQLVV